MRSSVLETRPPWQCLRQCVQNNKNCDSRVSEFVNRNFYVDNGLFSYPTDDEALEMLQKTQTTLIERGNLNLTSLPPIVHLSWIIFRSKIELELKTKSM